jgi:hypothetical protein
MVDCHVISVAASLANVIPKALRIPEQRHRQSTAPEHGPNILSTEKQEGLGVFISRTCRAREMVRQFFGFLGLMQGLMSAMCSIGPEVSSWLKEQMSTHAKYTHVRIHENSESV